MITWPILWQWTATWSSLSNPSSISDQPSAISMSNLLKDGIIKFPEQESRFCKWFESLPTALQSSPPHHHIVACYSLPCPWMNNRSRHEFKTVFKCKRSDGLISHILELPAEKYNINYYQVKPFAYGLYSWLWYKAWQKQIQIRPSPCTAVLKLWNQIRGSGSAFSLLCTLFSIMLLT